MSYWGVYGNTHPGSHDECIYIEDVPNGGQELLDRVKAAASAAGSPFRAFGLYGPDQIEYELKMERAAQGQGDDWYPFRYRFTNCDGHEIGYGQLFTDLDLMLSYCKGQFDYAGFLDHWDNT